MHLEALEHVVAVFLLCQTHRDCLAILLDFASQKPRELATVAEFKVLAESVQEGCVHYGVIAGCKPVVDVHREHDLGFRAVLITLAFDEGHPVFVQILETVVLEPGGEELVPARCALLQSVDI